MDDTNIRGAISTKVEKREAAQEVTTKMIIKTSHKRFKTKDNK